MSSRYNWLDWMKTIGMYLIVYGHFTSYGHEFVYTFSVPLFFVMSGFLYNQESDSFKKNFYNLILPMLIMTVIVQLRLNVSHIINGEFTNEKFFQIIIGVLIGDQTFLGACWFIYTLLIIKLVSKFCTTVVSRIIFCIICSFISILLSHRGIYAQNSWINVCLSYPFFLIGMLLREYKVSIVRGKVIYFAVSLFITYICSVYNGPIWVFKNDYGHHFLLYLLGGMSGTLLVYIVCLWLDGVKSRVVLTISTGSIIVLGLHFSIIFYFRIIPELDFLSAFVVLILFVPVIRCCERYVPILLGKYRVKSQK